MPVTHLIGVGAGGVVSNGTMPPLNETHRKEYSRMRPACNQWKLT